MSLYYSKIWTVTLWILHLLLLTLSFFKGVFSGPLSGPVERVTLCICHLLKCVRSVIKTEASRLIKSADRLTQKSESEETCSLTFLFTQSLVGKTLMRRKNAR